MASPSPVWVWVASVGLAGYLASLLLLIWHGFDRHGRWRRHAGWWWIITLAVSFLLLVQGLRKA